DIAASPYVSEALAPLLQRHRRAIDTIRARAQEQDGVVFFDLTGDGIEAHNKFIAYMQFPSCRYTVGLTRGPPLVTTSTGYTPWSPAPRTHDIACICERYGGGGHPVVGAISLPPDQLGRAREIVTEVVAELRRG